MSEILLQPGLMPVHNTPIDMRWNKRCGMMALLSIMLVAGGVYGWKEFHRAPLPVNRLTPHFTMPATELAAAFIHDEAAANERFLGKVIRISGRVDMVSSDRDSVFNIMIGNARDGLVSCTLDKKYDQRNGLPADGDWVVVQGICAGVLAEVELTRCTLMK